MKFEKLSRLDRWVTRLFQSPKDSSSTKPANRCKNNAKNSQEELGFHKVTETWHAMELSQK